MSSRIEKLRDVNVALVLLSFIFVKFVLDVPYVFSKSFIELSAGFLNIQNLTLSAFNGIDEACGRTSNAFVNSKRVTKILNYRGLIDMVAGTALWMSTRVGTRVVFLFDSSCAHAQVSL